MALVLSFPPRLAPNGTLAKVDQFSAEGEAEALAQHILVRPGERELIPEFGTSDPTFSVFSQAELGAGAATFGPSVEVDQVRTETTGTDTVKVTVSFD